MIKELYLKKAANIRKDYLKLVSDIGFYENLVKNFAQVLESRSKDLETLSSNFESGKLRGVDSLKEEFHKIMVSTEEEVGSVEKTINSIQSKMDKLREDEISLYRDIKQSYHELNDDQIRAEIAEYLKKLNLS